MTAYVLSDRHSRDEVCDACGAGKRKPSSYGYHQEDDPGVRCARIVVVTSLPTPPDSPENTASLEVSICVDCARAIVAAAETEAA